MQARQVAYEAEKRAILNHAFLVRQIRNRIESYAAQRWNALGSYRDEQIDRFVAQIVPVVETGQKQIWGLTVSYLDSMSRLARVPTMKAPTFPGELRGVSLLDVYRRPAVTTYTALSQGKPFGEALELGRERLGELVQTDMQMSHVRSAFERLSGDKRVQGYERTLDGADPCPLCVIASTQRYSTQDLSPIHPG
jgi:hypothetical protein